jgi:hypothetical protein
MNETNHRHRDTIKEDERIRNDLVNIIHETATEQPPLYPTGGMK